MCSSTTNAMNSRLSTSTVVGPLWTHADAAIREGREDAAREGLRERSRAEQAGWRTRARRARCASGRSQSAVQAGESGRLARALALSERAQPEEQHDASAGAEPARAEQGRQGAHIFRPGASSV